MEEYIEKLRQRMSYMLTKRQLREWSLQGKTEEEINREKDRWVIEDAADKIADAIRTN